MIRQISSDRPTLREAKDMIERRELSPVA
jgi:hypothetical protein